MSRHVCTEPLLSDCLYLTAGDIIKKRNQSMPYVIISIICSIYSVYCYSQYNAVIKQSSYYPFIAIIYGVLGNVLWVYLSRRCSQVDTLKYAIIWDGAVAMIAFLIPVILFGNQLKLPMIIAMALIMAGVAILMIFPHQ